MCRLSDVGKTTETTDLKGDKAMRNNFSTLFNLNGNHQIRLISVRGKPS